MFLPFFSPPLVFSAAWPDHSVAVQSSKLTEINIWSKVCSDELHTLDYTGDLLKLINIGMLMLEIRFDQILLVHFWIMMLSELKIELKKKKKKRSPCNRKSLHPDAHFLTVSDLLSNVLREREAEDTGAAGVLNCLSWVECRWHSWLYSKQITESDIRNPTEVEGNRKEIAACRTCRLLCIISV